MASLVVPPLLSFLLSCRSSSLVPPDPPPLGPLSQINDISHQNWAAGGVYRASPRREPPLCKFLATNVGKFRHPFAVTLLVLSATST